MDWAAEFAIAFIIWVFLIAGISSFVAYDNRRRHGKRSDD